MQNVFGRFETDVWKVTIQFRWKKKKAIWYPKIPWPHCTCINVRRAPWQCLWDAVLQKDTLGAWWLWRHQLYCNGSVIFGCFGKYMCLSCSLFWNGESVLILLVVRCWCIRCYKTEMVDSLEYICLQMWALSCIRENTAAFFLSSICIFMLCHSGLYKS